MDAAVECTKQLKKTSEVKDHTDLAAEILAALKIGEKKTTDILKMDDAIKAGPQNFGALFASIAEKQQAAQTLESAAHKLYTERAAALEGDLKDAAEQKSVTEKRKENADLLKKLMQDQEERLAALRELSRLRAEVNVSNLTKSSKDALNAVLGKKAPPHAAPLSEGSLYNAASFKEVEPTR